MKFIIFVSLKALSLLEVYLWKKLSLNVFSVERHYNCIMYVCSYLESLKSVNLLHK